MWGGAFTAKEQPDQALAKFVEADKYTHNWGRPHLNWGEALFYAGKSDEAKVQFALAAELDLTPTDRPNLPVNRPMPEWQLLMHGIHRRHDRF